MTVETTPVKITYDEACEWMQDHDTRQGIAIILSCMQKCHAEQKSTYIDMTPAGGPVIFISYDKEYIEQYHSKLQSEEAARLRKAQDISDG
jgi:hypothetical protein